MGLLSETLPQEFWLQALLIQWPVEDCLCLDWIRDPAELTVLLLQVGSGWGASDEGSGSLCTCPPCPQVCGGRGAWVIAHPSVLKQKQRGTTRTLPEPLGFALRTALREREPLPVGDLLASEGLQRLRDHKW